MYILTGAWELPGALGAACIARRDDGSEVGAVVAAELVDSRVALYWLCPFMIKLRRTRSRVTQTPVSQEDGQVVLTTF